VISYVFGDLFMSAYHAQMFAHDCTCAGAIGAGVAAGFRTRYLELYEEYRHRCKGTLRAFNPGDVFLWKDANQPWIFNLAPQEDYWRSRATYAAGVRSIAMPRIGAGARSLSWRRVRATIERVFSGWKGALYVHVECRDNGGPSGKPRRLSANWN
jgi:O-acetyl-ADP-ribose deacetylase (regulator of RNase III)